MSRHLSSTPTSPTHYKSRIQKTRTVERMLDPEPSIDGEGSSGIDNSEPVDLLISIMSYGS